MIGGVFPRTLRQEIDRVLRALRRLIGSTAFRLSAVPGLLAVLLGACAQATNANPEPGFFPPPAATVQGDDTSWLYSIVFWIATVIFFLVEGLIVYCVFRYRRRKGDDTLPAQTHGNTPLEITLTILPLLLVLVIFGLTIDTENKVLATSPDPALTVDVTGFQWQWTFDYKDQGLSYTGTGSDGPTMVVPVGQTVHIRLHSNDVIHSFYVRDFLFKRDVIPGRTTEFDFEVKQPGTYSGQCAEFCGLGHHQMFFTIQGVTPADFGSWVKTEQAKAAATPTAGASGGSAATVIKLTAKDVKFSTSTLTAPAGQPFTIQFTNDDAVPHNVAIFEGSNANGKNVFRGKVFPGPGKTMSYNVPALPAGTYYFHCDVHPTVMNGTLTVK
jgi:cytochrome c oxidase subunit 2